jgi:hypothetical protein
MMLCNWWRNTLSWIGLQNTFLMALASFMSPVMSGHQHMIRHNHNHQGAFSTDSEKLFLWNAGQLISCEKNYKYIILKDFILLLS